MAKRKGIDNVEGMEFLVGKAMGGLSMAGLLLQGLKSSKGLDKP